ncbi:integrase [Paenibacillus sp. BIHB 4019]|uniref:Integrase n=1 Tax=Paenibacillus sp. BIHB 4019 TaxID=1870819 RepID=A0A1B2DRW1_9BACL|nr:site-specific integrase [Paenibacillus sp. BIHB 4019]ANY70445.1 integrase [Paenibacillus sp. BIHB 4019]
MASYVKRGKTWQYTISRMINGKPDPIRKGGFATKKEAQVVAGEIEEKLRKGIQPHLRMEPFDEYYETWVRVFKPNIAKNTLERYLNTHKTLQEHFGGVPIQEITKRRYQEFLNVYGATRTRESVRKLNTHIRACVRNAIDEGIIQVDFTRGIALTGSKAGKKEEDKYIDYEDAKKLITYLKNNLDTLTDHLILLGLSSGFRFGELVGLTKKDFLFESSEIQINKTWGYTKKMKKGFGPTKNAKSDRTINIDPETMGIFQSLLNSMPENPPGLIFYSAKSMYKCLSNGGANKRLDLLLNQLGISSMSMHGLRHTHASILLYKKVSIYYVSERLGHADIDTTMKYYAHIVKELREEDQKNTTKIFTDLLT